MAEPHRKSQASKLPSFQLPLHPRHVCDVPKDVAVGHIGQGALTRPGERKTENGACSGEAANLPRLQNAPAGRRERPSCGKSQTSKPPNFQASIARPAYGSTPPASVPLCLLCVLCVLRNLRFHLRCALCVPSWFFVSLAVEGLALWACTVVAAQRSASSPPRAAARAFTSVAPPNFQPSKPPNFQPSKPPNFQSSKLPSLQSLGALKKLLDQFISLCYLMAVH